MRIAIVNDIPMVLEGLRRVIIQHSEHEIAWLAANGKEAVERAQQDTPDLILMDLIMPVLDGVEATRQIMESAPCPILVVTSSVDDHIADVFRAMSFGALDAVSTPLVSNDTAVGANELMRKIETTLLAANASVSPLTERRVQQHIRTESYCAAGIVAIGASSGGPRALVRILESLPQALPCAIVIVQHVDEHFAPRLVDWLASRVSLNVQRALAGQSPEAGTVYVAVSSQHLTIDPQGHFYYDPEPLDYPYRPSIDVFFASLADYWSKPVMGILLTGMGADGAWGLKRIHDLGHHTVAQDEETSAVYGMPKVARDLGAATEVLALQDISGAILKHCNKTVPDEQQ